MPVRRYSAATRAIYGDAPDGSRVLQGWGSAAKLDFAPVASVAISIPNTTQQAALVVPWAATYIYDIVISCTASGAGTQSIDIWNTTAAGTVANRIPALLAPIVIPANIATLTAFSARFTNFNAAQPYNPAADPTLSQGINLAQFTGKWNFPFGSILSLRAATNGTGGLTNLNVSVLIHPFNNPLSI